MVDENDSNTPEREGLPLEDRFFNAYRRVRTWEQNQRQTPLLDDEGNSIGWQDRTEYLLSIPDENGAIKKVVVHTSDGGLTRPQFIGSLHIMELDDERGEGPVATFKGKEIFWIGGGYRGHSLSLADSAEGHRFVEFGFRNSPDDEQHQQIMAEAEKMIDSLEKSRVDGFFKIVDVPTRVLANVRQVAQIANPPSTPQEP